MAIRRLLLLVLGLFLLTAPATALAEPPQRLDSDLVDRAGVLGPDAAPVRAALDALRRDTGDQLFVIFVRSFDGADGQTWTDESARRSQLGARDVLFAVAVDDRAYGLSVDQDLPLDDRTLDDLVSRDVEPRLAVGDWAGATVALADGVRRGGASGGATTPWIVGGALALAGGAYLVHRRRRRTATPRPDADPDAATDAATEADEHAGVGTADLGYRANAALIDLDDAVRTSEQELGLARGQFGEDAVTGFRATLQASRAELVRAFEIRQRLDDEVAETEPERRAMLAEILRICATADARLDAQAEDFDRLRDLERTVPEVLARLTTALDGVEARLPDAERRLATLRTAFAAAALGSVADNLPQARSLLAGGRTQIVQAQAALAAGRRGEAAVGARAGEEATEQAGTLVDGIGRLAEELAQARARIADTRADLELDLAEARALGDDLAAVVARTAAALAAADRDLRADPPELPDPPAVLRRLTEAASALDAALATARAETVRDERARVALDGALLAARSAVAAASDFLTTRRGAVGSEARTRLAEAQRHLDLATGQAAHDPVAALARARQADALARAAQRLAEQDVSQWSARSSGAGAAVDLGSLVLGGILFGDGRGGGVFGRGASRGGGFGGGFSPGSFGGSGTRGRRGTGGRF